MRKGNGLQASILRTRCKKGLVHPPRAVTDSRCKSYVSEWVRVFGICVRPMALHSCIAEGSG